MSDDQPIGVFDSGLGGLTVLRDLNANFPNENFLYLGDTARLPYGSKSPASLLGFVKQNIQWMLSRNCKGIVVACNSASTVLNEIQCEVPIYGVIEAGAKFALAATKNNSIGVIGTRATIQQKSYVNALQRLSGHTKVYQQACPLLVPLVEEAWTDDPITNLIVYRYLSPLLAAGIDTLILGCTHYPILKDSIRKVMGTEIQLIESGAPMTEALRMGFRSESLKANTRSTAGELSICATDVHDNFIALAQRILSPNILTPIERVQLDT